MKRKVIQLAGKTLIVSLPSKWAKAYGVKKGDDIEVSEDDKRLIISPDVKFSSEKVTLSSKDLGHFDKNYISYLYQKGCDEIRINYDSPEISKDINERVSNLLGFEIIDKGENYFVIKNVSDVLEEEFDTLLRRTFLIIIEIGKSSLDALKKDERDRLEEIGHLEDMVDKFTDFCKRLLNKKGFKDFKKTPYVYTIIRDLEKVGDFYKYICEYLSNNKDVKVDKETLLLLEQTNNFFELYYNLFYKFSKEKATEFHSKKKSLLKQGYLLMEKRNSDVLIVHHLVSLIMMISDMYGPYYMTQI
ncbi:MAG: phosphate uptake regulator PhoU [Nanoarchaeota archaeon]|nr:phosphate uptake regulator PhoU [Nanoarchaeota archaeon]MBU1269677.1 phosphate uptake regulator PhoU [Nanoarchaeota archaeon]MBU1604099.1 phosphate uptake regulator PhoU [Nanoarchaeota archaeon]